MSDVARGGEGGLNQSVFFSLSLVGQPILASPAHHNNVEEDWEAAIGKNSPVNSFPMSPPSAKSGFKVFRRERVRARGVLNLHFF